MKTNCIFCNKDFCKGKEYYHIKNTCTLIDDERIYKFCCFLYTTDAVDIALNKYIEGYSMDELRLYGFSRSMFTALLNERHIPVRTMSESSKSHIRQNKYIKTCIETYGTSNASQNTFIKQKKANTFMSNYGVDNVRKCQDFRENHGYNRTMLERYNALSTPNRYGNQTKWWSTKSSDERSKMCGKMHNASIVKWYSLTDIEKYIIIEKRSATLVNNYPNGLPISSSSLETRISSILKSSDIYFKQQVWVNRTSYDFMFDNKILLEVQGDYWHASPLLYNTGDIITHRGILRKVDDIWNKDKLKKENAESYGYRIYYIWESELNSMSDSDIYNFIDSIISTE